MANTWQAPITGEPRLGEPHWHPTTLVNVDPASTAWTVVDCSSAVPIGATMITAHVDLTATGAAVECIFASATAATESFHVITQVANQAVHAYFNIMLTTTRSFAYKVSNTAANSLIIYMKHYWL